jgi:deoxyribodipyrimidine photolyase
MDVDLQARYGPGARIVFTRGSYLTALRSLCQELEIGSIVANRRYEPLMDSIDRKVQGELGSDGVEVCHP